MIGIQTCPLCGVSVPRESNTCPGCGASFESVVRGYCSACQSVVEARQDGRCSRCGGELYDRRSEIRVMPRAEAERTMPYTIPPTPPPLQPVVPPPVPPPTTDSVLHHTKAHSALLLSPLFTFLLGLPMCAVFGLAAESMEAGGGEGVFLRILQYIVTAIVLLAIPSDLLNYFRFQVSLTSSQLRAERIGLFGRRWVIPLSEIRKIRVQKLFGGGVFTITTSRGRVYRLPRVREPEALLEAIYTALPVLRYSGWKIRSQTAGWVIFAILLIVVGVTVVAYGVGGREAFSNLFPPAATPVAMEFNDLTGLEEDTVVRVVGILGLPRSTVCEDQCGVLLRNPTDASDSIWIFIDAPRSSSTEPAPNQMQNLGYMYTSSDFQVITWDGKVLGDGDRVRLTGTMCLTEEKKNPCLYRVTRIEAVGEDGVSEEKPAGEDQAAESLPTDESAEAPPDLPETAISSDQFGDPGAPAGFAIIDAEGAGVTLLDGSGWRDLTEENSPLGDDYVRMLAACPDGRVLIGHGDGISVFSQLNGQDSWEEISRQNWGSAYHQDIACGPDSIWVAHQSGFSMRNAAGVWISHPQSEIGEAYVSYETRDLLAVADGQVWWLGDDRLLHYDGAGWEEFNVNQGLGEVYDFVSLAVDRGGDIWAAHDRGVLWLDGASWTPLVDTGYTDVASLFTHPQGSTWLGTDGGFLIYDAGEQTDYEIASEEIAGATAHALAVDGRGRIWFGTSYGLRVLEGDGWVTYHMSDSGLEGDDINQVILVGGGPEVLPGKEDKADGGIAGVLTKDGAPMAGYTVEVCVKNLFLFFSGETPCGDSFVMRSTTTDPDGRFSFAGLPPSWYSLAFKAEEEEQWTVLTAGIAGISTRRILVEPGKTNDLGVLALTSD